MMTLRALALLAVAGALAFGGGCLAGLPPDRDPRHLEIQWRSDYAQALDDAKRTKRPLLIIGAAGHLTREC